MNADRCLQQRNRIRASRAAWRTGLQSPSLDDLLTLAPLHDDRHAAESLRSLEEIRMSDKPVGVEFVTDRGTIRLRLFPEHAPVTVASFANLVKRGFYDGLGFHRVIPDFMVQGGCPRGTGTGDPGYRFEDECTPELRHDGPGKLSMANAGPGTNGSQFFITHVATPWLDDAHTIFGEVVGPEDQEVVNAIAQGDKIQKAKLTGDADSVFAGQEKRLEEWNKTLDRAKR